MTSLPEPKSHPTLSAPRGNELADLIEYAHRLRAEETGRIMRKLFGLAPAADKAAPMGEPLPKEG